MSTQAKVIGVPEILDAPVPVRPAFDGPTLAQLLDKLDLGKDAGVRSDPPSRTMIGGALKYVPWPMMLILGAWTAVICFFGREIISTLLPLAR